MRPQNAGLVLEIDQLKTKMFPFKSRLSLTILLILGREGGACDLRIILRSAATSPITTRQHVQMLADDGYLAIGINEAHRRAKRVELTTKGAALLAEFESEVTGLMRQWKTRGQDCRDGNSTERSPLSP